MPDKAAELRVQALAVLREGWALGSIGVAANLFLTYLILLAALRFVGVSSAELSAPDAFAAFAIAFWAGAVFPITGSGLGVVDAVLIAMLIELGGASDDALVAAALLWRVFYSLLTLPLGAITLEPLPQGEPRRAPTRDGGDATGMSSHARRVSPVLPFGDPSRLRRLVKVLAWLVGIGVAIVVLDLVGVGFLKAPLSAFSVPPQ